MSNRTWSKIYIQAVFAVKYRMALLEKPWRSELFSVVGNLINETGARTIIVNGVEDHVHCFFWMQANQSASDIMKVCKSKSSKWINDQRFLDGRFEWQRGFGAFSYHESDVSRIIRYVQNQEQHHQKKSFKEEYTALLKEFKVQEIEEYLFHEPLPPRV